MFGKGVYFADVSAWLFGIFVALPKFTCSLDDVKSTFGLTLLHIHL